MSTTNKGLMIIVSGPAGCGKSTVINEYMSHRDNCVFSISATSRLPRPGEKDGVNYYFVSKEKFKRMLDEGEMLEYTEYCGNYYGSPIKPVLDNMSSGIDVLFDIEVNGATQVKNKYPSAVLIFMKPPSMEILRQRLEGRNTETKESLENRTKRAIEEMKCMDMYDYVIVNDTVEQAVKDLAAAIKEAHNKNN